jgi:hypothetical protein
MTLTKELELAIQLGTGPSGRLPRFDSFARRHGLTPEQSQAVLREYAAKVGKRVRGVMPEAVSDEVSEEEKPEEEKWYEKLAKGFDWTVDKGSVFIAVFIALVLCGLSLWIMGPSTLEKWGFVALAFVIVLFGYRALVKKVTWLWILCELVAGFLGVSFVLCGIDYQTNLTADDRQLTALETAETNARTYLETLQGLQATKGEGYKAQVETQQGTFDKASALASAYRVQVANKPKEAPEIKAYDILLAIPKAVLGSAVKLTNDLAMIIALVLFGAVFFILPATLYTTVIRKPSEDV